MEMDRLPLLPTMGVGSYAAPGWFFVARQAMRDGAMGALDIEELFEDATRLAVDDQIAAGLDIISDGELRRQRFVYEMFERLSGLERRAPARRLGVPGYDRAPGFVARGVLSAPDGLGTLAEHEFLRRICGGRPVKVALPGPLTFAGAIDAGARGEAALYDELAAIVHAELSGLAAQGAEWVQIDEPGLATGAYPFSAVEAAGFVNRALAGIKARRAVHVCFGNNAGRPCADRRMAPLLAAIGALDCDLLVLEFANREMAECEVLRELGEKFDIAAGVVDVKNFHVETADEVARRIDRCLEYVDAARLTVTADCGFSALPRYLARRKLEALVAGARLVRGRA
jgi:5-methyltetrahydropteroyltriglutamate--homocysteine methyltransferase